MNEYGGYLLKEVWPTHQVSMINKTSVAVYIPRQPMHDNFIISIGHNYTVNIVMASAVN